MVKERNEKNQYLTNRNYAYLQEPIGIRHVATYVETVISEPL